MSFTRTKSKKCPVCVGYGTHPHMIERIDSALENLREYVRTSGAVPSVKDPTFYTIAVDVGVAPHALRYHLKNCLLDFEIQDQRLLELKDLSQAIGTAKQEYFGFPNEKNAAALATLLQTFMKLADSVEEQQDPDSIVTFVAETVISPMIRQTLGAMTEELKKLRTSLEGMVSKNQQRYIDSQIKAVLSRTSSKLGDQMQESLGSLCEYFKVEFEVQEQRRMIEASTMRAPMVFAPTPIVESDTPNLEMVVGSKDPTVQ